MLRKLASLALVIGLVCTLGGTPVFADALSDSNSKKEVAGPAMKSEMPARDEARPNEELRANMVQLVADAKAGKVAPAARPQIQPARSNNLSKGKKIAIGVAIAVAVVAVVVIVANKKIPGRVL